MVFYIRRLRYLPSILKRDMRESDFKEVAKDLPEEDMDALMDIAEDDLNDKLTYFVKEMYNSDDWTHKWRLGDALIVETLDHIDVSGDYMKLVSIVRDSEYFNLGDDEYSCEYLPDMADKFYNDDEILPLIGNPSKLRTTSNRD
jgi:hypothetical protein